MNITHLFTGYFLAYFIFHSIFTVSVDFFTARSSCIVVGSNRLLRCWLFLSLVQFGSVWLGLGLLFASVLVPCWHAKYLLKVHLWQLY